MSDEEYAPMDGMDEGDMSDDMGDMEGMGSAPASALPEGITKEVITEAPADSWKKPKKGDEVEVHYVGTLESDGSQFDSSRDRGQTFKFTLGTGSVIKGWDLGVATMKKGETAKFTISPEFGYGDAGAGEKIPGGATLVFEVELIGWSSKDDLFGDGGVVKTLLVEGSGWKKPKVGEEVLISLKSTAEDGSTIEEKQGFEYTLGQESLGKLSRTVDRALGEMKKGESSSLACSVDYAYGEASHGKVTVELSLDEVYETRDVSLQKDGSVMKKQVRDGQDWDKPKDGNKCVVNVLRVLGDSATLVEGPKEIEFVCGNGDVCDALEMAVVEMKKGEKAVLTCAPSQVGDDDKLCVRGVTAAQVVIELEMKEFDKGKDTWSMSEEEKLEYGLARKEVGANLFRAKRIALAQDKFKKVGDLFNYVDNYKDEGNKGKAKDLKRLCELNKAACALKLNDYQAAKTSCNTVLKEEGDNVKALFRRAQAEYGLKNFLDCIRDCKRLIELEPQNREVRALLKQAQAGQKEEDKKSKGLFANMCKALGKGPIPEPGKAPHKYGPLDEDMDGDEDDGEMPGAETVPPKDGEVADGAKDGAVPASNGA